MPQKHTIMLTIYTVFPMIFFCLCVAQLCAGGRGSATPCSEVAQGGGWIPPCPLFFGLFWVGVGTRHAGQKGSVLGGVEWGVYGYGEPQCS